MSKEILIHIQEGERRVAIIEDGTLDDFYIEVDRHQSILGNIYKGKVESILPSINGAFVDIGQEKNGFLYLTDAINPLLEEDIQPDLFIDGGVLPTSDPSTIIDLTTDNARVVRINPTNKQNLLNILETIQIK